MTDLTRRRLLGATAAAAAAGVAGCGDDDTEVTPEDDTADSDGATGTPVTAVTDGEGDVRNTQAGTPGRLGENESDGENGSDGEGALAPADDADR